MRELDYHKMGQRIRQARKAKGWSQGVMVKKCGSSPGVFISELFQNHYDMDGAGPFSKFAAMEDDLLEARGISELSHEEDAGGCVVSLDKKACDVNGAITRSRTMPLSRYGQRVLTYTTACFLMPRKHLPQIYLQTVLQAGASYSLMPQTVTGYVCR